MRLFSSTLNTFSKYGDGPPGHFAAQTLLDHCYRVYTHSLEGTSPKLDVGTMEITLQISMSYPVLPISFESVIYKTG